MMKNEEQVRFWKGEGMAYIKVLSRYSIGETKGKPQNFGQ